MAMTHIVNMHEAKTNLSKLVARAHEGDEIIIARAGRPVAKIVPYTAPARKAIIGALKEVIPDITDDEWEESDRQVAALWKQ